MKEIIKIYVKDESRKPTDTLYTFFKKRILKLDDINIWTKGLFKKVLHIHSQYTSLQCHKYRSFQDIV
jgi:hypothetical protein